MKALYYSLVLLVLQVCLTAGCPGRRLSESAELPEDHVSKDRQLRGATDTTTVKPSKAPVVAATQKPSKVPVLAPTFKPTKLPVPVTTAKPVKPTKSPTRGPTGSPVVISTNAPIATSSSAPTVAGVAITSAYCLKTGGAALTPTKAKTCSAYSSIKTSFTNLVSAAGNSLYKKSTLFGKLLRLAYQDAGEVDVTSSDNLGPDGCLSSTDDNGGLIEYDSTVYTTFEPIWQANCDSISRADFWVLMAKMVLEYSSSMSINYQYGRKDVSSCQSGAGRLPDPAEGLTEISRVFVTQMGLTLDDAVALIGGHTLGHTHINDTGYGFNSSTGSSATLASGRLSAFDDTPASFDNHYYTNLVGVNWCNSLTDDKSKSQWAACRGSPTVMLPADIAVAFEPDLTSNNGLGVLGQECGPQALSGGTTYGCTPSTTAAPTTYSKALSYSQDQSLFLTDFSTSFVKMVCAGYGVPANVDGATASGKLGTLTAIDLTTC